MVVALVAGCAPLPIGGGQSAGVNSSRSPGLAPTALPWAANPTPRLPPPCPSGVPTIGLSTDRPIYSTAGPVTLTLTLTNAGPPCTGPAEDCANRDRVYVGSTELWGSRPANVSPTCPGGFGTAVPAGTTIGRTWTWDGCASPSFQPGPCIGPPPPGIYTAVGQWGQFEDSPPATFQLTAPGCKAADVDVAVSTDGSTYAAGQSLHIEVIVSSRVAHPCLVRAGTVVIRHGGSGSNGGAGIKGLDPCDGGIPCMPLRATAGILSPGGSTTYSYEWDQDDCSGGSCPGPRAVPGVYILDAGEGTTTRITLT